MRAAGRPSDTGDAVYGGGTGDSTCLLKGMISQKIPLRAYLPILCTQLGLEIEQAKIVVLKTGSNFKYFDRWRSTLIHADSPGTTQSNLHAFDWRHLPRPTFPLDDVKDWKSVRAQSNY